jgi:hypothetical protein
MMATANAQLGSSSSEEIELTQIDVLPVYAES